MKSEASTATGALNGTGGLAATEFTIVATIDPFEDGTESTVVAAPAMWLPTAAAMQNAAAVEPQSALTQPKQILQQPPSQLSQ